MCCDAVGKVVERNKRLDNRAPLPHVHKMLAAETNTATADRKNDGAAVAALPPLAARRPLRTTDAAKTRIVVEMVVKII